MKRKIAGITLLALATVQGCKTGYNRTYNRSTDPNPPKCATAPADANLSSQGLKVFNLTAGLTCASPDYEDGYLVGQSVGFGNELNTADGLRSYKRTVTGLDAVTSHTPAIVAVDYEFERLFTKAELLETNVTLKKHWDDGGLVSVSWMPLSPWQNDFSDITGNPGTSLDVFAPEETTVDLADLLDNTTNVYKVWRNKLAAMADVLEDLQERGVVVMWRPLPEMNTDTYWWGTAATDIDGDENDAAAYVDLWQDMFDFFQERGLHNLLWVYSPSVEANTARSVGWAYPGDEAVDIVAGIARNDSITIPGYKEMVDLGRPVAMAEFGPAINNATTNSAADGRGVFDNTTFADRLQGSFPAVAFWVSPHSTMLDAETRSNGALVDNLMSKALMDRKYVFSLDRMVDKKMRE